MFFLSLLSQTIGIFICAQICLNDLLVEYSVPVSQCSEQSDDALGCDCLILLFRW